MVTWKENDRLGYNLVWCEFLFNPPNQNFVDPTYTAEVCLHQLYKYINCNICPFFCKVAQAQSDWVNSSCAELLSNLSTDPQFGLGLDFDWAILTQDNILI
ncbi:hypothetical protein ATANTOWER_013320 [Ataeniobius toweri]|uniref:Uncharacterized protein n=1 Tax=Ataeniobius toweri TaxID=208326 RepID=A0ABU7BFG9_9TELE|nr:hypothetical protein [Ataeniobius toweri]